MTKINIEEWFSSPKRWEREHECLNMENINEKPCMNNPASVSMLSGLRKPQIRF